MTVLAHYTSEEEHMSEKAVALKKDRMLSLDVFRGLTIAGMILVNNPGTWSTIYGPLKHAPWHGWTPTDFIFPFFLFIVGVAMTFSFDRRLATGQDRMRIMEQVVRLTIIMFVLGLIMAGFPNWRLIAPFLGVIVGLGFLFTDEPPLSFSGSPAARLRKALGWVILAASFIYFISDYGFFRESKLRIPGVLQRISLCYFFTAIIMFHTRERGRIIWAAALVAAYWVAMKAFQAPADFVSTAPVDGRINDWIDVNILGSHLYRERPDPEGLLSTLPSIATTLLGVLCGNWLHREKEPWGKLKFLLVWGVVLTIAGALMHYAFPINKKIWTPSYVVFMGGLSFLFLAFCYYVVDMLGWKKWAYPFMVFGTNPIFVFFLSGIVARLMYRITIPIGIGKELALKPFLYEYAFLTWLSPLNASLAFAIAFNLFWLFVMIPLYENKVFIKI